MQACPPALSVLLASTLLVMGYAGTVQGVLIRMQDPAAAQAAQLARTAQRQGPLDARLVLLERTARLQEHKHVLPAGLARTAQL